MTMVGSNAPYSNLAVSSESTTNEPSTYKNNMS